MVHNEHKYVLKKMKINERKTVIRTRIERQRFFKFIKNK